MKKEFPSRAALLLKKEFPDKNHKKSILKDSLDKEWDFLEASSATDCTGLMPAPPITEDEYDSYGDIQRFLPPGSHNS